MKPNAEQAAWNLQSNLDSGLGVKVEQWESRRERNNHSGRWGEKCAEYSDDSLEKL